MKNALLFLWKILKISTGIFGAFCGFSLILSKSGLVDTAECLQAGVDALGWDVDITKRIHVDDDLEEWVEDLD